MHMYYSSCLATNITIGSGGSFYFSGSNNIVNNVCIETGGSFHLGNGASALAVSSAVDAIVTSDTDTYIEFTTTEEIENE